MELIRVSFEKKMILRNLMELYQYDMSDFEDDEEDDVNEYGLFDYMFLDHYWTEEGRLNEPGCSLPKAGCSFFLCIKKGMRFHS